MYCLCLHRSVKEPDWTPNKQIKRKRRLNSLPQHFATRMPVLAGALTPTSKLKLNKWWSFMLVKFPSKLRNPLSQKITPVKWTTEKDKCWQTKVGSNEETVLLSPASSLTPTVQHVSSELQRHVDRLSVISWNHFLFVKWTVKPHWSQWKANLRLCLHLKSKCGLSLCCLYNDGWQPGETVSSLSFSLIPIILQET